MGLILSDSQEVETGKRVRVFCLFDSRQLCGLPSVGGGSFEVHELSLSPC